MKKLVAIAAVFLATIGCKKEGGYVEPPPPDVTVARPLVKTVTNYLDETGTTEAVQRVEIRARVRGYLIEQLFEAGTDVKEGDLLYRIDPREFQAKVDAATAELNLAKVALEKAEIEYTRQRRLRQDNATSESDVVAARAERDGSIASVAERTAQLDQAKLNLDYTEIRSPIDGRVGKTLVKLGNLVGDNEASHLTTVISYDPIYANFNISERDLLEIRDQAAEGSGGREAKTRPLYLSRATDDGFPFVGEFDYADLAVDQSTGTFLVRGKFPNPDFKVLPGLFVTVRIPLEQTEDALLIPRAAVSSDQAGRYVWTVGDDDVVKRADVELGVKYNDLVVIRKGLTPDQWVIIEGIQRARAKAKVNPQQTELPDTGGQLSTVEPPAPQPRVEQEDRQPGAAADDNPVSPADSGTDRQPADNDSAAEADANGNGAAARDTADN